MNNSSEQQKAIFATNLKHYLTVKGLNQKELAQRAGLGAATITEYMRGRSYPSPSAMQRMADVLGVYMSDLREPMDTRKNTTKAVKIPVLGDVPAGIPIEAVTDIIDYEEISAEMARSGEYFGLRIKGDSMEPKFSEGDVVIVRKQNTVENGEIAVVLTNKLEKATIKKFYRSAAGVQLVGTNPNFAPLMFTPAEVDDQQLTICGKVVELRAKF